MTGVETLTEAEEFERLIPAVQGIVECMLEERGIHAREREDMISDGYLGALLALRSFDPSYGVSKLGYARYRIRGQVQDGIRRRSGVRRDPKTGEAKWRGVQLAMIDLDEVDVPQEEDQYRQVEMADAVNRLLAELSPAHRDVLVERFVEGRSFSAMARDHDLSRWKIQVAIDEATEVARCVLEGKPWSKKKVKHADQDRGRSV